MSILYSSTSFVTIFFDVRREYFLGYDLSGLSLFLVAFGLNFLAWQLMQLPWCMATTIVGPDGVSGLAQHSVHAVSHALRLVLKLVFQV